MNTNIPNVADVQNGVNDGINKIKNFDIKAFLLGFGLNTALCFLACHFIAWWAIAPVCGIIAAWRNESVPTSMTAGFAAGLALFSGYAMYLNVVNAGELSAQVATIFSPALSGANLVQITGVIGGLLGTMGAWAGVLFRRML